jgi:hypothetical protein
MGKDGAALVLFGPNNIKQLSIFMFECFAPVSRYQTLQHREAPNPRMHQKLDNYLLHHAKAFMVQSLYCLSPTISNSWAFSCLSVLRQYRGIKHYSIGRPLTPECTKNLIPVCYNQNEEGWCTLGTVWAQQYQTVEHFHVWVFCASVEATNTTA